MKRNVTDLNFYVGSFVMSLSVPAATEADFPFNAQGRLFFSPLIFAREKVAEVLRRCCRNINLRNVWLQRTSAPLALAAQLHSMINHDTRTSRRKEGNQLCAVEVEDRKSGLSSSFSPRRTIVSVFYGRTILRTKGCPCLD